MNKHWISAKGPSEAWAKAFLALTRATSFELMPLIVSVNTAFGLQEDDRIKNVLDRHLSECDQPNVETVASTIFPRTLWNPMQPRQRLYDRYERIWPMVKKTPANRFGTYFHRFVAFQGRETEVNQLEHIFSTRMDKKNHRRSALQLAVFDPNRDHVDNRQRGFPCLHQVAITPASDGTLAITGFYATQTVFEKAYGNYLGLIRLGDFIAHEMGMKLSQMTCIASIAKLTQMSPFEERRKAICQEVYELLGPLP